MIVTRTSQLTGEIHTRDIPGLTQENLDLWAKGVYMQNAMPHISAEDREFIRSGVTPEEWDKFIGAEEEE